jgi:hypothetical protein
MDDLRCTIDTKSDQLNADDLIGINRIIRVTDVQVKPGRDRPLWISFNGDNGKPYKPNITMRKLLIFAWSSNRIDWIGRSMELYNDPEVKFGLQKVGGIKISRVSHISKEIKAMLQTTRGKRTEFIVGCLPSYPEKEFTEKSPGWIAAIKARKIDIETVIEKAAVTGILTESQIEILKGALEDVN